MVHALSPTRDVVGGVVPGVDAQMKPDRKAGQLGGKIRGGIERYTQLVALKLELVGMARKELSSLSIEQGAVYWPGYLAQAEVGVAK